MFPLFAFTPFINIPFILFDTESLKIGSYRKLTRDPEVDIEKSQNRKSCNGTRMTQSIVNLHENIKLSNLDNKADKDGFHGDKPKEESSLKYGWFRLKTYYTAPVNKFLFNLVTKLEFHTPFHADNLHQVVI